MSLLRRNAFKTEMDIADHFSGAPHPTFWSKWFGGVVVSLWIAIYALRCCISQQAVFVGSHHSRLDLSGRPAIFFGLAWLSGAFFLHFHYFWPTLRRLGILADLGKTISLLCLIGAFGYVLWSIIMG
jgi:hypothetical protein